VTVIVNRLVSLIITTNWHEMTSNWGKIQLHNFQSWIYNQMPGTILLLTCEVCHLHAHHSVVRTIHNNRSIPQILGQIKVVYSMSGLCYKSKKWNPEELGYVVSVATRCDGHFRPASLLIDIILTLFFTHLSNTMSPAEQSSTGMYITNSEMNIEIPLENSTSRGLYRCLNLKKMRQN
jgi:hypothetical protein